MGKSMRTMLLMAKAQPTIDVDPVPVAATDAMLVRGFTPALIEAEFIQRNLILPWKGNMGALAVGVHRSFEFEIELAGSGVAGTAPKWAPCLKATGWNETVSAGVSVTYAPVSTAQPWVTLYGYLDGVQFKMLNCWGTVSFELNSKGIPVMKYRYLGEYQAGADVAFPGSISYSGFVQPKTVGKTNTLTLTWQGTALKVDQLSLDMAAALVFRDLIGGSEVASPNRNPVGTMTCEMPTIATKNFAEVARLGTTGAFQVIHGTVAGNIARFDAPVIQINGKPAIQNKDDIAMVQVPFQCLPNAGNDEVVVTLT
jgi:hypothetical protein